MRLSSFNRPRVATAAIAALAATTAAVPASAGTTSGTIGVSLTVTNACVVNDAPTPQTSAGSLGNIRFPDQPGIFGDVDGQLSTSVGTLKILCSPGIAPALTIGAGANDSSGQRRLASNGNTVSYRLFSDSSRLNELAIGQQIQLGTATTSPFSVPLFARVNSGGAVLSAGTYTDTVQVTLSW